ncbi:HAD family hydrolase [Labilibacter sediminis]|nr:HAD family hydrolase [Labilibacter sediminis]
MNKVMGMEVKAVIFDLDGTIINTIEDIADANNRMLQEFGYPTHNINEYIGWIGNGARTLVEASLPPQKRNGDTLYYLDKYEQYYRENINNKSKLYPQIDKLFDFLTDNNILFAINTNKPQHLTDIVVDHYLKKWSFTDVIGHRNHFPHKPDPTGALHFAKQINCDPKYILFIGDSMVDIQTALAAGMIPMGVSWGYGQPQMQGDDVMLVDRPGEILDYINETTMQIQSIKLHTGQ